MSIEKKNLEDNVMNNVNGGIEIEFNDDGTVKDILKPKDVTLYTAEVIKDLISPTIPKIQDGVIFHVNKESENKK